MPRSTMDSLLARVDARTGSGSGCLANLLRQDAVKRLHVTLIN